MIRKSSLYQLGIIVWGLLSFGAMIVIGSGNAQPYLGPSVLPFSGLIKIFGNAVALWMGGTFLLIWLERRDWKAAGRAAGLSPTGGSLFGKPNLVGEHDGRSVRAYTVSRKTGTGGDSGSRKTTYTVVEAELAEPTDVGLIVGVHGIGHLGAGSTNTSVTFDADTIDEFSFVGASEDLARDVLTARVREAMQEPSRMGGVRAGNARDVILEAVPDVSGAILGTAGDMLKSRLADQMAGGPASVTTESKGALLSGTEMRAQVEAVAAVADAFEAAVAELEGPPADDAPAADEAPAANEAPAADESAADRTEG